MPVVNLNDFTVLKQQQTFTEYRQFSYLHLSPISFAQHSDSSQDIPPARMLNKILSSQSFPNIITSITFNEIAEWGEYHERLDKTSFQMLFFCFSVLEESLILSPSAFSASCNSQHQQIRTQDSDKWVPLDRSEECENGEARKKINNIASQA